MPQMVSTTPTPSGFATEYEWNLPTGKYNMHSNTTLKQNR